MKSDAVKFVLDACSLIAFIRKEEGSERMVLLLQQAGEGAVQLFLHKVTLAEVYYDTLRSSGKSIADATIIRINKLPVIQSNNLDDLFLQTVGKYKVSYKISFADCFVLALAETGRAAVVSTDHHEFDPLAQAGTLPFFWLR